MKALRVYVPVAVLARSAGMGTSLVLALASVERTGGPAAGAYVLAAVTLPHVLAGPVAGVLADRTRHRRALYAAAMLVFGACVCAAVLLVGRVPLAWPLLPAVLAGCCQPLVTGGLSSLLDELVAPAVRLRARGLDAATYNVAELGGPPLYAGIAAATSPSAAGIALAAMISGAGLLMLALPLAGRAASGPPRRRVLADLRDGLACLVTNRRLGAVTLTSCLAFVGTAALPAAAVLLSLSVGGPGGGAGAGLLMSLLAAGALAGSLAFAQLAGRISAWVPIEAVFMIALAACGTALLGTVWAGSFAWCAVLFALAGFFDGPALVAVLQVRSEQSPPHLRTQVFTLGAGLKMSSGAAGVTILGWTSGLGASFVMAWIAVAHVAAVAIGAALLLRRPGVPGGRRSRDVPVPSARY